MRAVRRESCKGIVPDTAAASTRWKITQTGPNFRVVRWNTDAVAYAEESNTGRFACDDATQTWLADVVSTASHTVIIHLSGPLT